MKPENRGLLSLAVCFVLVLAVTVAAIGYLSISPSLPLPPPLPIPAGTTFTGRSVYFFIVHFYVSTAAVRLVGAWTAYNGSGSATLVVRNGTLPKPLVYCPLQQPWVQYNGSVDTPLHPGPYTMYWNPCFYATRIAVTQTIQLARAP